VKLAQNF